MENTENFLDLRSISRSFIEKNPETAATTMPIMYAGISPVLKTPSLTTSRTLSTTLPRIVGMERTKEYSAANLRFIPQATPAVIVEPEREIPGRTATAWTPPTISASFTVIVSAFFLPATIRSQRRSITELKRSAIPTKSVEP